MCGVKTRLDYIESTMDEIYDALIDMGESLDINTPINSYPQHIQNIIDNTVIPQSDLDYLMEITIFLNGENATKGVI